MTEDSITDNDDAYRLSNIDFAVFDEEERDAKSYGEKTFIPLLDEHWESRMDYDGKPLQVREMIDTHVLIGTPHVLYYYCSGNNSIISITSTGNVY